MKTAIFRPYDMGNSEGELHAVAGERVELVGEPRQTDPVEEIFMQKCRTTAGFTFEAFLEELTEHEGES